MRLQVHPVHRSQRFVECNTLLPGPAMLARGQGNSQCCSCEVPQRLNHGEPLGMEGGSKCVCARVSTEMAGRSQKHLTE